MIMTVFTHCWVDSVEVGVYFCPLFMVFSSSPEYAGLRASISRWSVDRFQIQNKKQNKKENNKNKDTHSKIKYFKIT